MLRRFDDWPSRLHSFIRSRRNVPYEYGFNDCFWFVHGEILSVTGADILPGVVPPTSRIAAAKFLVSQGYGDVEDLMTARLGSPFVSVRCAGRGDVISFTVEDDEKQEPHLAVVDGVGAITPGRDRLIWVPRVLWRTGWRV